MKKSILLALLTFSIAFSARAHDVVNEKCITNLIVMQEVSSNIAYDSKWLLDLVNEHSWVGGENRKELISETQKIHNEYKANYEFIFNNKKKDIINNILKQECLTKTDEKLIDANSILQDIRNTKKALLLTIANTKNIMEKFSCNIEEVCSQELNDAFMAKLKEIKESQIVKEQQLDAKLIKQSEVAKKSSIKKRMTIKKKEDVKICY